MGPEKNSLIARGPLKMGSTIKRFDCIYKLFTIIHIHIHNSKYCIEFTLFLELAVAIWCPRCPAHAVHNCGRQELEPYLIATASSSTYLMMLKKLVCNIFWSETKGIN